jgi:hypothetical protein
LRVLGDLKRKLDLADFNYHYLIIFYTVIKGYSRYAMWRKTEATEAVTTPYSKDWQNKYFCIN